MGRSRLVVASGILLASMSMPLFASPKSVDAREQACAVAGQWKSTLGTLNLAETDSGRVSAVYATPSGQGRLEGQRTGNRLDVTWAEPPSYAAPDHAGAGYFDISGDCGTMTGKFGRGPAGAPSDSWRAVRLSPSSRLSDSELLPADLSKRADQLSRLGTFLSTASGEVPKTSFEVGAVVDAVGKDPDALRKWVASHTSLVPYRGLLRGPIGVLMDRRGNSLDRALLLGALIKASGFEVRLARGTINPTLAGNLLASTASPENATPSDPAPAEKAAAALASDTGFDPAVIESVRSRMQAEQIRLDTQISDRVASTAPTLLAALQPLLADRQIEVDATTGKLAEHWWVQVLQSDNWVDLELGTEDGHALTAATATYDPDAIPEEFKQQIEVQLIAEFWDQGKPTDKTVLDARLHPADFPAQTISLVQVPIDVRPPTSFENVTDLDATVDALAQETSWLPAITTADGQFFGHAFDVTGAVTEASDSYVSALSDAIRTGQRFATANQGALGALGNALSGNDSGSPPANGPDSFVAEWLDITISVPGEQAVTHRRTIFDLRSALGLDATTTTPASPIGDQSKRLRALGLSGDVDLLLLPASPSAEYLAVMFGHEFGALFSQIGEKLAAVASEQMLSLPDGNRTLPLELYAFAEHRFSASGSSQQTFIDRPNVVALRHRLTGEPSGGSLTDSTELDIVENSVSFAGVSDKFAARLLQGVADTVTEAAVLDATLNTELFPGGPVSNASWTLIQHTTGLQSLQLVGEEHDAIATALGRGDVALINAKGDSSTPDAGSWWQIDPRTGRTLGIGTDGAGQSLSEHVALVLNLTARMVGMAVCAKKLFDVADQIRTHPDADFPTGKAVGGFMCVVGVTLSFIAKFDKFMPGPAKDFGTTAAGSKMMSDAANSWMDAMGTAIGAGGGVMSALL